MTPDAPAMNVAAAAATAPLCWICKKNKADSGEHKTKRSDLLAVLGKPSQSEPLFYHDLHKRNQPVGSLDAKILKNPIRIYELNFSWQEIIAAGAGTLGKTYTNLTQRTDGFDQFAALLQARFPAGTPSGLTTDNPFRGLAINAVNLLLI
jgi:hypothetical protein